MVYLVVNLLLKYKHTINLVVNIIINNIENDLISDMIGYDEDVAAC